MNEESVQKILAEAPGMKRVCLEMVLECPKVAQKRQKARKPHTDLLVSGRQHEQCGHRWDSGTTLKLKDTAARRGGNWLHFHVFVDCLGEPAGHQSQLVYILLLCCLFLLFGEGVFLSTYLTLPYLTLPYLTYIYFYYLLKMFLLIYLLIYLIVYLIFFNYF